MRQVHNARREDRKDEGLGVTLPPWNCQMQGECRRTPRLLPITEMASWDRRSIDLIHSCVLAALTCTACYSSNSLSAQ